MDEKSLKKVFAANAEHVFIVDLGMPDPKLIDYIVDLLVKFVRTEVMYKVGNHKFNKITEMFDIKNNVTTPRRDIYKHIGDLALFWDGFYSKQNYQKQGKLSYYIASTYDDDEYEEEAPVLRRLSEDFELCSIGLNKIKHEFTQEQHNE
jgi:hypothetical protein